MESNDKIPGKGAATASMVLGIISVVLWFFGYSALVSVILGIVGLILAGNAKKAGFVGGIQIAWDQKSILVSLIISLYISFIYSSSEMIIVIKHYIIFNRCF